MRWFLVLTALVALLGAGLWHLPPAWQPWTPLDLRHPPNLLTNWKLRMIAGDPAACTAVLETAELGMTPVPDRPSDVGCEIENAVILKGATRLSPAGPTLTCPMAVAWTLFDRHALQPAAREAFGTTVATARHMGTFACRNVNHAASGRRSQHATANAIDIAGFTLSDGREISVLRHWPSSDANGRFLRAVRDGACRWFGAVLGPDYNAAHRDHFHFDRGRWGTCR